LMPVAQKMLDAIKKVWKSICHLCFPFFNLFVLIILRSSAHPHNRRHKHFSSNSEQMGWIFHKLRSTTPKPMKHWQSCPLKVGPLLWIILAMNYFVIIKRVPWNLSPSPGPTWTMGRGWREFWPLILCLLFYTFFNIQLFWNFT
jgi:hypothetical protein